MYALDTQVISKMIYPKLKSHGIEDINYHMNIEFDDEDPIYGAKIVAAFIWTIYGFIIIKPTSPSPFTGNRI